MAYSRGYKRKSSGRRSYKSSSRRPARKSYSRAASRRVAPARRRVSPATNERVSRELSPGERFVIATVNPFEPAALGAKIPDSNTVPSVAIDDLEILPLTLTTATNTKCYAFRPGYTSAVVESAEAAGGWTWPVAFAGATNRAKRSGYASNYELDRPVAHGVKIASPVAPTAATGWVHIALAYESFTGITSWPWPLTTAGLSGYQWYKRVTLASLTQQPLTIVNKFVDETAFRYLDAATADIGNGNALEFSVPKSWGTILIAFEGVGSLNPITVEHQLLTESIPKNSASVSGSPAAPPDARLNETAANISASNDFTTTADSGSGSRGAGGGMGSSHAQGASTGTLAQMRDKFLGTPAGRQFQSTLTDLGDRSRTTIKNMANEMVKQGIVGTFEAAYQLVLAIADYRNGAPPTGGVPGVNIERYIG